MELEPSPNYHISLERELPQTNFSSSLGSCHLFLNRRKILLETSIHWYCQSINSVTQSCPTLFDPMDHSGQASLSITNSRSLPKLMPIESVMPPSHLILCFPLFLPPSIFPSIRVFSNESALHIRWQKYWSFNFNISPSNECSGLI